MKEDELYDSYKCPNCEKVRKLDELKWLFQWHTQFKVSNVISVLSCARQKHLVWACDKCIESETVILGKPEEQNWNGITYPFFTHNDEILKCENCDCSFQFSKEEKKFWYEDLKFITWSYPKNCQACRKKIREPKILSKKLHDLIINIDKIDAAGIEEIINIFLEYGNISKAIYYLSVLKKKNVVDEKKISEIKERITNLAQ